LFLPAELKACVCQTLTARVSITSRQYKSCITKHHCRESKNGGKNPPPAAYDVHRHAAADPAALIAQGFSRLLGKKERLKNLHVESRHLLQPVAKDASVFLG